MKRFSLKENPWTLSGHDTRIKKQILVGQNIIPHMVQYSRAILKPGQIIEAHTHTDLCETFLVTEGEILFIINGSGQLMKEGQGVVIQLGEEHSLINKSNTEATIIYFGINAE